MELEAIDDNDVQFCDGLADENNNNKKKKMGIIIIFDFTSFSASKYSGKCYDFFVKV